jgi:hypothetical protein
MNELGTGLVVATIIVLARHWEIMAVMAAPFDDGQAMELRRRKCPAKTFCFSKAEGNFSSKKAKETRAATWFNPSLYFLLFWNIKRILYRSQQPVCRFNVPQSWSQMAATAQDASQPLRDFEGKKDEDYEEECEFAFVA